MLIFTGHVRRTFGITVRYYSHVSDSETDAGLYVRGGHFYRQGVLMSHGNPSCVVVGIG